MKEWINKIDKETWKKIGLVVLGVVIGASATGKGKR